MSFCCADRDEKVRVVLALKSLDEVLIDGTGLAQTGHSVAPECGSAVNDGDVLERLHRAQADFAAQLDREQNVLRLAAVVLRDQLERAAISANSTSSPKVAGARVDGAGGVADETVTGVAVAGTDWPTGGLVTTFMAASPSCA